MSEAPRQGRLIGVVGPSGVGKDTVMEALAHARPDLRLVRRVITRPESAGGESFTGVSAARFAQAVEAGEFALHWQAHGLSYGIPETVRADLARGDDMLVNLSRSVLSDAQEKFPGFITLSLTAPASVLAKRLAQRGRESEAEIVQRLSRAGFALPEGLDPVITVSNDKPVDETVREILDQLLPERA